MWDNESRCHAFVVELQGMLCVVLSDPKWDHGLWTRAYTINLKLWPYFSLATNVVVPLAVDPTDGRVLLNTRRKLAIENLYALDQASLVTSKVQRRCPGVCQKCITRCGDVPSKFSSLKLSMAPCDNIASPSTIENLYALDQASLVTSKVQRRCPGVCQKCITRCGDVPSKFSSLKLSMAPCDNIASPSSASSRNKELNCVSPKIMPVVPILELAERGAWT
uniref:Uncharacterized protein n=1 Tax=Oryza meridionalis TaxID=40149 RepID=A0A0E0DU13_9ORYZ